ncbi:MAG: type II secretion system F family protein [Pseudomonadota bacterium]
MKTFIWEGTDQHNQTVHGKIQAPNSPLAREILQNQSIKITSLFAKNFITPYKNNYRNVSSKDISLFLNQLATLISANIALTQSIQFIQQDCKKIKLKALLHSLLTSLREGNSFSYTLKQHPQYFATLICQLIHIAEQSGTLDIMLNNIIQHDLKTQTLKNKIKKALLYPAIIIFVTLIVLLIMFTFIIPQFATLFESYSATLPWLTRMVIHASTFIKNFGWILFIFLCGSMGGVFFARQKYPAIKQRLDDYILHVPCIGNLIKKTTVARIAHALALMLAAGIPLLEAIKLASKIPHNLTFSATLNQMQNHVRQGQMLHHAMRIHPLFSALCVQMVAIGEEAGKLEEMLQKVAFVYESDIDRTMGYLERSLEPMLMTIISVIVGILVAAMYLPIFKLGRMI